jgi:uncharacterized coiled-coil protein SlyX
MNPTITISVDFPALDSLVAYLEARATQQKQVDALAAQVSQLTQRLRQSEGALDGAEQQQP